MKKNLLNWMTILMVAIVSVGFVSCSNDDDDNNESRTVTNYKEAINGTWRVTYDSWGETETDIITFNGANMYFEAVTTHHTYNGTYSVVENIVYLSESTDKYPFNVIVISNMTESSFVGKTDDDMVIKGTRIK